MAVNLYEQLEVSPRASAPVIKAAYRCLVQIHHPDKNPDDPVAADRLVQINHAYSVLSEQTKRADYDRQLDLAAASAERRGSGSNAVKTASAPASKRPASRSFAFRPLK